MNDKVDGMAKAFLKECIRDETPYYLGPLYGEKWYVTIHGEKFPNVDISGMYEMIQGQRTMNYWHARAGVPNDSYQSVWWEASKCAVQDLSVGYRRWRVKFATGHCGVGHHQRIIGMQNHARCPRCSQDEETTIHVIRCPEAGATARWKSNLAKLEQDMERIDTMPELQKSIITLLETWRRADPIRPASFPATWGIRAAIQDQHDTLGWDNFVHGRWSPKWERPQRRHYQEQQSRRTSRRWAAAIIKKLFLTAWDMWDHRNFILHHPQGPKQQEENRQLNLAISEEYRTGFTALLPRDRKNLCANPVDELHRWRILEKQKWLRHIRIARDHAAASSIAPGSSTAQQLRRHLAEWLATAGD